MPVSCVFFRQREALKNAVEAFQEERTSHIELYEKQQKVKADFMVLSSFLDTYYHSVYYYYYYYYYHYYYHYYY